jgi:dTDP-4-amino-4,6-dideoxygalactose transaminase
MSANQLAINGGPKAKTTPYGTGKRFTGNELAYLQQALEQNTLFYGTGKWVKRACEMMKEYLGLPHVVACTSGTAAIHLGLIAAGIGPGDEVILTPNTDSGSAAGIIEEGAVPVFCDCEWTLQPSARTVSACITDRTRAVVVIHLAGHPAPVEEILEVCRPRGIAVIEDCAQSWGTRLNGKRVGTFSAAGCYSINDFKHISTGDGGFVALSDPELYRRVHNYADKFYDRFFNTELLQAHHGMNYRMSELQGAVACAQLERVEQITSRQHDLGDALRQRLVGLPGARVLQPIEGGYATYWWTAVFIEPESLTASRDDIAKAIQAEGIPMASYGKYDLIQKPLFQNRQARPWLKDARSSFPFDQPDGRSYHYSVEQTPTHKKALETGLMMGLTCFCTDQDIAETATGIRKVFETYIR